MRSIAYDRVGSPDDAPLVLVHGLGGDRHVWAPVVERIAPHRDVVTVDLPGFGGSAPLADDASPPALAAALARFLEEEIGWPAPHVAGNSLGGWVGLELARGGHARSVTAIAPAGFWPRPLGPKPMVMRGIARGLSPLLPVLLKAGGVRRFGLSGSVAHPERIPYEAAVRMARAYADAPGFVEVNRAMRSSNLTRGEEIDVPVTIGWCELDRLVARPREPVVRAREVVLRDCGHVPTYDDPDAVARLILQGSEDRQPASSA